MGLFQKIKEVFPEYKKILHIIDTVCKSDHEAHLREYCETRSPVHGELPVERKSCVDCKFLKSYATWWCTNEQAKLARGTSIPGVIHCPYWELDIKYAIEQNKLRKKR